nr:hypothetical protein [Tanacetum cinerariifolium]
MSFEPPTELEAEKARRRGQEFNWETATYGNVYNDALETDQKMSFEPP